MKRLSKVLLGTGATVLGIAAAKITEKYGKPAVKIFTTAAIKRSAKEVADKKYGLNFEAELFPFLQALNK